MPENNELKNLMDARAILAGALMDSIGLWEAYEKVNRAIRYIDTQTAPIIHAMLADDAEVAA